MYESIVTSRGYVDIAYIDGYDEMLEYHQGISGAVSAFDLKCVSV